MQRTRIEGVVNAVGSFERGGHPRFRLRDGYYDYGFGVNISEALRQDLIVDISLLNMRERDRKSSKRLEMTIWHKLERLSSLAGARVLSRPRG